VRESNQKFFGKISGRKNGAGFPKRALPRATEASACRQFIPQKLCAAGWPDGQICEQRTFTTGRIISPGDRTRATRHLGKRAGSLLKPARPRHHAQKQGSQPQSRPSAALRLETHD
jgi:hypothetical protein